MLYVPASKPRALDKAAALPADALILDLEDAVLPQDKAAAREGLLRGLASLDFGARRVLVRVNGLDTAWGRSDVAAFMAHSRVDGLLVPKVAGAGDLDAVAALAPDKPLWAMLETPMGVLHAGEIAAHPALVGMVMGTNDLAMELGARFRPDRLPLIAGLGQCLLAARARGKLVLDGVYNAFQDEAGLRAECAQGRDMGFDGKTVIHPAQIGVVNAVFAPSAGEVALAQRQIAAFEAAGQGVAVVDGRIVENLHIVAARALLAKAHAVAAMEGNTE
jgi:(3S)-malyl-CoA thioesterase